MKSEEYHVNHLAELPRDFIVYGAAFALFFILAICAFTLMKAAIELVVQFLLN